MNATPPEGRGVPESGLTNVADALAATSTLEKADVDAGGCLLASMEPESEQALAPRSSRPRRPIVVWCMVVSRSTSRVGESDLGGPS
jgi:hypothetical protein